jgi:hypothetical protein
MSKQKKGTQHKENPTKLANTRKRRERRAAAIAARKLRKPMPVKKVVDGIVSGPVLMTVRPGRETKRFLKFGPPRPRQQEAA